MGDLVQLFAATAGRQVLGFTLAFTWLTLLEFALPNALERQIPLQTRAGDRASSLVFWIIWIPAQAAMFVGFVIMWRVVGWRPFVHWDLGRHLAPLGAARMVVGPLLGALVGDFFFYWFHRGQHTLFWRFHAVHHSIEDLNAVNSYHHITEELMRSLLMLIPMSWFTLDVGDASPIVGFLLIIQPVYLHSSSRLHLGSLRWLLADNRFHRIHHSLEPRHFDKNFGAFTSLWDSLFGTAHFPRPDEWPDTGIREARAPRTVSEWIMLPWAVRQARSPADRQLNPEAAPQPVGGGGVRISAEN